MHEQSLFCRPAEKDLKLMNILRKIVARRMVDYEVYFYYD